MGLRTLEKDISKDLAKKVDRVVEILCNIEYTKYRFSIINNKTIQRYTLISHLKSVSGLFLQVRLKGDKLNAFVLAGYVLEEHLAISIIHISISALMWYR